MLDKLAFLPGDEVPEDFSPGGTFWGALDAITGEVRQSTGFYPAYTHQEEHIGNHHPASLVVREGSSGTRPAIRALQVKGAEQEKWEA